MSTESKHIDDLFDRARKAEVEMSAEDVAKVIAGTTIVGSIAAVLFGKFKIMNIFLLSATVITTTAIVVNANISTEQENSPQHTTSFMPSDEPSEEENPDVEVVTPIEHEDSLEIKFVPNDPELANIDPSDNSKEDIEPIEVDEAMSSDEDIDDLESESPYLAPQDYEKYDYFNQIMSGVGADIQIKKGTECGLNLITKEFEDVLDIKVKDKALVIHVKKDKGKEYNKLCKKTHPKMVITMKDIEAIYISGSGDITCEDDIPSKDFEIYLSGSGDIDLSKIAPKTWKINLSGSGDIRLNGSGSCGSGEINIAGSGDVKIPNLATKEVEINIAGSGDAKVNASEKLDISIAGSGDVCYSGSASVSKSVQGSGDVRKDCK